MSEETILNFEIIEAKFGYVLACLSSYSSLDLSKRISEINDKIVLMKRSFIDDKDYVDIRDVIKLRETLKELEKKLPNDNQVSLQGHKIACLLFELSIQIKVLMLKIEKEDFIEYLSLSSKFLYDCGRIVNVEILCYEK